MPFDGAEVSSSFQKRPAYRYLRKSDHLPTYEQTFRGPMARGHDIPLSQIEAKVKLFNPTGIGTWYVAAYDPEDRIAWGLADLHEREIGSFSMQELVDFRGRFGLPIERDLHWRSRDLQTLKDGGGRYRIAQARTPGSPTRLTVPPMAREHYSTSSEARACTCGWKGKPGEWGQHWREATQAEGRSRARIPGVTYGDPGWSIPGVSNGLTRRSSRARYASR